MGYGSKRICSFLSAKKRNKNLGKKICPFIDFVDSGYAYTLDCKNSGVFNCINPNFTNAVSTVYIYKY